MQLNVPLSNIQGFGVQTTLFGIPFFFSFWTVVAAIFISFVARVYIEKQMRKFPDSNYTIAGIGAGLTAVLSILFHEGAHSMVGWWLGLVTTHGGMSWWGAYVAFDHRLNTIPASHEILIGLSGVAANAIIFGLAAFLVSRMRESRLENAIQFVAIFNYRLLLWNLLPIVGLDGSKVLEGSLRLLLPTEWITPVIFAVGIGTLVYFLGRDSKTSPVETFVERI